LLYDRRIEFSRRGERDEHNVQKVICICAWSD
jgi:hypothetical protein